MSDFRRFYGPGLDHVLHLEELHRSASTSRIKPVGSGLGLAAIRRRLALALRALAERIDPVGLPQGAKVTKTA
jgi:hypothetical protein